MNLKDILRRVIVPKSYQNLVQSTYQVNPSTATEQPIDLPDDDYYDTISQEGSCDFEETGLHQ